MSATQAPGNDNASSADRSGGAGNTTPVADAGVTSPPAEDGAPPVASDGALFSACASDEDCGDGLNCYEFGGYCGTACAQDEDCEGQGAQFACSGAGGGGGFPGGGMSDGGMSVGSPQGVCRASCDGEDDSSCPEGLVCLSVGGGFMGGGFMGGASFRCAVPDDAMDGDMQQAPAGEVPLFGECSDDGDCVEGLGCTASGFGGPGGGGGSGYCTQDCMGDEDCTEQPASGSAIATCGFGGQCTLECSDDEDSCPEGMTCNSFGGRGGGGGFAACGY